MSYHQPFKRCKLENGIKESSDTSKSLDQPINGNDEDDGVEMPTLLEVSDEGDQKDEGDEIPTLVVELLLHWIKDVKLLKTCRLVNKYWNSLACSSLQITSIAKIDPERLKEFLKFQESIPSRDLSLRPSPFKIIHMITDKRINQSFLKLAKIPNTRVTSIETYSASDDISSSERLNQLLKATMKDLTNLTIQFGCNHAQHIFQDIKLLGLKSLAIGCSHIMIESSRACNCLEPLNSALENTRLHKLAVIPIPTLSFSSFCSPSMSTINLSSIVKLSLCDNDSYNVWNLFPQLLQFPALKTFNFESIPGRNECKEKRLNVFLSSVASDLNELKFNWYGIELDSSLIFRGIVFPKLKFLSVYCPKDICSFVTQERFPSLKSLSLHVHKKHQMQFPSDGSGSLSTVRKVSLRIDVDVQWQGFANTPFPAWMLNLANIFPDTESLEVIVGTHSFSLLDISRAYPNLKFLRIHSFCVNVFLYGTCNIDRKTYEYTGLETEGLNKPIPVEPSLLDFKKLKSLDLAGIEISTEAFQHCLPRMTALEELTFTYKPGPSVNVLRGSLKHVKRIKIETRNNYLQNVIELQAALPGCEIIVK